LSKPLPRTFVSQIACLDLDSPLESGGFQLLSEGPEAIFPPGNENKIVLAPTGQLNGINPANAS